eukprot:284817388_1
MHSGRLAFLYICQNRFLCRHAAQKCRYCRGCVPSISQHIVRDHLAAVSAVGLGGLPLRRVARHVGWLLCALLTMRLCGSLRYQMLLHPNFLTVVAQTQKLYSAVVTTHVAYLFTNLSLTCFPFRHAHTSRISDSNPCQLRPGLFTDRHPNRSPCHYHEIPTKSCNLFPPSARPHRPRDRIEVYQYLCQNVSKKAEYCAVPAALLYHVYMCAGFYCRSGCLSPGTGNRLSPSNSPGTSQTQQMYWNFWHQRSLSRNIRSNCWAHVQEEQDLTQQSESPLPTEFRNIPIREFKRFYGVTHVWQPNCQVKRSHFIFPYRASLIRALLSWHVDCDMNFRPRYADDSLISDYMQAMKRCHSCSPLARFVFLNIYTIIVARSCSHLLGIKDTKMLTNLEYSRAFIVRGGIVRLTLHFGTVAVSPSSLCLFFFRLFLQFSCISFKTTYDCFFSLVSGLFLASARFLWSLQNPHIAIHGSISFMVNLHSIK